MFGDMFFTIDPVDIVALCSGHRILPLQIYLMDRTFEPCELDYSYFA